MDNARAAWELPDVRTRLAAALVTANVFLVVRPFASAATDDADAGQTVSEVARRFEHVRQNPTLADDPIAIDALAFDAQSLPPGPLRVQMRMFVAEAWLGRMNRRDQAIALLRSVSDDVETEPLTARLAEREIVEEQIREGRVDEAAAEAVAHAERLDSRLLAQTRRLLRRAALLRGAIAELGIFGALASVALLRALRRGALADVRRATRRLAPLAVAFAVYVAAAGGWLASRYEAGNGAPFVLFGVLIVPILFVARAWAAAGSRKPLARTARAILCAASMLAAAFVLLDFLDPTYLEGFGL